MNGRSADDDYDDDDELGAARGVGWGVMLTVKLFWWPLLWWLL
jgi:hypothetical protein